VLISGLCAVGSEVLAQTYSANYFGGQNWAWSRALLITGILIKLAAVPMFFWLLSLADEIPALLLGLIIAVVDIAAFGEFFVSATNLLNVYFPSSFWLWCAALTSLLAALLMLTQGSLKRLLVLSTIEDVGFLFLCFAWASHPALNPESVNPLFGIQSTFIAASTHALAKALLFACLAAPEAAGELNQPPVALASRYPCSAFGFVIGMLAMLGVPPTMGFIGRWRLYSMALQIGPWVLAAFILSSIFALIAYTLALTRNWWGPPGDAGSPGAGADSRTTAGRETGGTREPLALKVAIVGVVIVLLGVGFWPAILEKLMEVRP
jgi:formate hydrogenlyase subunit 3/multisubunit Na+/H+ antiporter MnhD subunit